MDQNQVHQEDTHRPTHRFQSLFFDLFLMGIIIGVSIISVAV